MTRYWSDTDGCFIECESVWDGRSALTDSSGFVYRESYLATLGANQTARADGRVYCACGKLIRSTERHTACFKCRAKRESDLCACGRKLAHNTTHAKCSVCRGCDGGLRKCACGNDMDRQARVCQACWAKKPPREACALCRANGYLCRTCKARANGLRQMQRVSPSGTAA